MLNNSMLFTSTFAPNPFGYPMDGRAFSSDKYRFGFNGKENDNEVKGEGNSLDFGGRIYDSRLGRFLSIDPDAIKYPYMSPYCFAANNPIKLIDIDGKGPGDPSVVVDGKTAIVTFTYKDVPYQLSFKFNKPQEYTLTNQNTGKSQSFDFYTTTTTGYTNKKSMALFKFAQKALVTFSGAKDPSKLRDTKFGNAKVIDLVNAALEQNPTFKVGIVGNVCVSDRSENGKKTYNFLDHNNTDFDGFVKERAENVKKGYFENKDNVKTYGINEVPVEDKKKLDLSPPNQDTTGATLYLKATPSTSKPKEESTPSF